MSSILSGSSDFFGLDIGTTAIRLVQLHGSSKPKVLLKYAYIPLEGTLSMSDAKVDQQKLAQTIAQLVKAAGVNTRNAAIGIPSNRVFTTVADVEDLSSGELAKAITYEADSLIPTPLEESKIDWAIIGNSPADKTKKEILLTSVPNKFVEERLDMLESIGLNVIAFEPDYLAMARSLSVSESTSPQMILDIGNKSSDLVIVINEIPHLSRSIPSGVDAFVRAAQQNLSIDVKQAQQFVFKFGLSQDKLEGQVYQAINGVLDLLTSEIEKSMKYFHNRYKLSNIDRIIVTGGASVIPEFPLTLANRFNLNVEIGNSWRNISYSQDRQNELLAISNQFGVAAGLAERL
ncbi:MAG TPA: type IV pilus assembly protein PilM [Patescibacteria group bacterium]|nr:type IV pilus assembly protein PilM [Patescibacteria group bacterium]